MRKTTIIVVDSKENSTDINSAYTYGLSVIIAMESTSVCNGSVLS
jgi:hypothetical protein